ncbi:MAG: hypothetical protein QNJ15_04900 [Erythrobacter sp.]|nr:hypothetical protein [Erythrobacter sp.]
MKRAGIAFALLAVGALAGAWIDDWFDIDRCLDRGGMWDYELETCRYE